MNPTNNLFPLNDDLDRRKFISQLATVAGAATFLASPLAGNAEGFFKVNESVTVGQIMDLFIKQVTATPYPEDKTVDTLKAGNRDIQVTGIVTTMFATIEVIRKTIQMGANFIIAHEPTFYNHQDKTDWLANDEVYKYKAGLLKQHNIAVWRNHDYIHTLKPDGVMTGLLTQLGWKGENEGLDKHIVQLPTQTLGQLIGYLKQKLSISQVRFIGDPAQNCSKILLMPGAAGGQPQITAMSTVKPDVLICGEISEWETAEYVRDARAKGENLALVVLGHIASEEPGSEFMVKWLAQNVPGVRATHIKANNSLSFL